MMFYIPYFCMLALAASALFFLWRYAQARETADRALAVVKQLDEENQEQCELLVTRQAAQSHAEKLIAEAEGRNFVLASTLAELLDSMEDQSGGIEGQVLRIRRRANALRLARKALGRPDHFTDPFVSPRAQKTLN